MFVDLRFKHLAVVLCLAPALASCGPSGRPSIPSLDPQDPLWSSYISHHTSGTISRRDKIRIVFANDIVEEEQLGESAEAVLSMSPAFDGSVTYANTREILVVPAADLEPEQAYRMTLTRGELLGLPEELDRYEFLVLVMRQEFEVGVTGLSPDPDNDEMMVLRGTLVTADIRVEAGAGVQGRRVSAIG